NRGAALWGNLVITSANWPARIVATDKETGKTVWETNMTLDQPELRITAAPLPVKDKIIVGASGGDSGVRDYVAALDGATGNLLWRKFTIPAPASRAAKPGRATITPGRRGVPQYGSPAPMIRRPTRPSGEPGIRC